MIIANAKETCEPAKWYFGSLLKSICEAVNSFEIMGSVKSSIKALKSLKISLIYIF